MDKCGSLYGSCGLLHGSAHPRIHGANSREPHGSLDPVQSLVDGDHPDVVLVGQGTEELHQTLQVPVLTGEPRGVDEDAEGRSVGRVVPHEVVLNELPTAFCTSS